MKLANLLFVLLLIFMASSVQAQKMKDFKKEMKEITQAINLDDEQVAQLNQIYQKRVDDLNSIASLESTDEKLFYQKRIAIYKGSEASVNMLLKDETQRKNYDLYKAVIRKERAETVKKLKKKNASKQDIIDAQYGVQIN